MVDHRRVVKNEMLFTPWGSIARDNFHGQASQTFGQFTRIGDGRRTTDKLGIGSVKPGHPLQPPQDIGHMTAKDPPVLMHLIHNNVFQIFKELNPKCVMRQNALVQHIRICYDNVPAAANGSPCGFRGVTIEGESFNIHPKVAHDAVDFVHLVLAQGFGGKKVQGPGLRIAQDGVQYRQIVTEGFTTGGRRRYNKGPTGRSQLNSFRLMTVQLIYSPTAHHLHKSGIQTFGIRSVDGGLGRKNLPAGHMAREFFFGF